jgi:hypothetical protein
MDVITGSGYSDVTIKNYEKLLKRLNNLGIDYKKLKTAQELKTEVLKYSKVSDTSIRLYLQAIMYSGINKNKKFLTNAREFITETSKTEREERGENILIRNQKENYIDWDGVLEVYAILTKNKNKSMYDELNYVILSLYVLFPPRRLTDYSLMKINNNFKINKGLSKQYDMCNYYSPKKKVFVFNNYKTNKKIVNVDGVKTNMYKQQILKIPDELVGILNDYIKSFEIDNKLLEFTTKSLGDRVKRIFKDLVIKMFQ